MEQTGKKSSSELITEGIKKRKAMSFKYNGHFVKMYPYALGTNQEGKKVFFYQYAGGSDKPLSDIPAFRWRCLLVNQMEELDFTDDPFEIIPIDLSFINCCDHYDVKIVF